MEQDQQNNLNDLMTENTRISTTVTQNKFWKYIKNITIMTFPTSLFFLCLYLQLTINLIFVGRTIEVANKEAIIEGIGITHLYVNTTLLYVCIGLVSGFETLGASAYGIKNYRLFGLYYHRAIIVALVYAMVVITLHYFTALNVLILLGVKHEILEYIDSYLHTMIFYIVFDVLFSANFRYLNIINKSHINLITLIVTICLHPLWCYIFIVVLDMGVKGAGISIIISQFLNALAGTIYIWVIKPCPESVFFFNRDSFKSIISYLKITLPTTFLLCAEWWGYEAQSIIALWTGDHDYAAHILLVNIMIITYTISIGFGTTTVVFVGKLISYSTVSKTKRYAKFIFYYGLLVMSVLLIFIAIFRTDIIYIYMKQGDAEEVAEKATKALIFVIATNVFDYIQTIFAYVLRGVGRPVLASVIAFINFYIVQSSLSILLGVYFELGVFGIWVGICTGCFLCAVFYSVILMRLDFYKVQREVLERLENDNNDVADKSLITKYGTENKTDL
jgi:MATE family multidrug resistance protein